MLYGIKEMAVALSVRFRKRSPTSFFYVIRFFLVFGRTTSNYIKPNNFKWLGCHSIFLILKYILESGSLYSVS
jgi:hypothetical protein